MSTCTHSFEHRHASVVCVHTASWSCVCFSWVCTELSICTLLVEHVYVFSWACKFLQLHMYTLSLEHMYAFTEAYMYTLLVEHVYIFSVEHMQDNFLLHTFNWAHVNFPVEHILFENFGICFTFINCNCAFLCYHYHWICSSIYLSVCLVLSLLWTCLALMYSPCFAIFLFFNFENPHNTCFQFLNTNLGEACVWDSKFLALFLSKCM